MQFLWSEEKNIILKKERDISFEVIVEAIANDKVLNITKHPNKDKFKNQNIYIVDINGYCYLVPFVETEDGNIFLKTIFPSRKAVKAYMSGGKNDKEKT